MAYNSYGQVHRQQPQPQDQSSIRHYAGQIPANPYGGQHQPEDIQYRNDISRNGHNAPRGDDFQNGYMQDSYRIINQGYNDYNGHANAEAQGPGQGQGRLYQYDERYHNDRDATSRPNGRQQVDSQALTGESRRRAQSKRERCLFRNYIMNADERQFSPRAYS
jgi:hypothetical protein